MDTNLDPLLFLSKVFQHNNNKCDCCPGIWCCCCQLALFTLCSMISCRCYTLALECCASHSAIKSLCCSLIAYFHFLRSFVVVHYMTLPNYNSTILKLLLNFSPLASVRTENIVYSHEKKRHLSSTGSNRTLRSTKVYLFYWGEGNSIRSEPWKHLPST